LSPFPHGADFIFFTFSSVKISFFIPGNRFRSSYSQTRIAPGFLPLSFGTAKVRTFFKLANFIFYFSFAFPRLPFLSFSSFLAGCKGKHHFHLSKYFAVNKASVFITLCKSAVNLLVNGSWLMVHSCIIRFNWQYSPEKNKRIDRQLPSFYL
jgi:hypothetical protein